VWLTTVRIDRPGARLLLTAESCLTGGLPVCMSWRTPRE
jgi:hypothetical protein